MSETKLLQFAKFYTDLKKLELDMRNVSDLGHHLEMQPELLSKFDETNQIIKKFLDEQSNIFEQQSNYDIK